MVTKTARVHLRIACEDKALVRGERERAERLLADRTRFTVPDADWQAFSEALDRPAKTNPKVVKLFNRPSRAAL